MSSREARYNMAAMALQAPTLFAIPTKVTRKLAPVQGDVAVQLATSIRENSTDEELILAMCGGAEWAIELLYHRYARYTFALAYRMLRDISTAWRNEQHTLIRSALAQLPAEQRHVIELAYFGGFTQAEIAEREGIPLGTVKGRMRLGLQKLRVLLQE